MNAGAPSPSLSARLGLVLGGVFLALLAAEVLVRLLRPCAVHGAPQEAPQKAIYQYDERLGWRGRPGGSGVFASYGFAVRVQLDQHGYRSNVAPARAGHRNIVLIGDSVAWGWGVEDDEVAAGVMMRAHSNWNVYNLASPGYGTDQEYLALQEFLDRNRLAPIDDCVLVLYPVNDFDDVGQRIRYSFPKPRFVLDEGALRLTNVPVPRDRADWYDEERVSEPEAAMTPLEHSHLFNLTWGRYRYRRRQAAAASLRRLRRPVDAATQERRDAENELLVQQLLLAMRSAVEIPGARFSVMLVQTDEADERIERTASFLTEQSIPHARFMQHAFHLRDGNRCFDPHPNALGQERLAGALAALLEVQR
ncbi:MAG: hypothetical protein CL908_23505 [Deltaproteobacteria bacterium]|nr:hypothetical protein [Deltaproteobacteria bacterium]